MQTRPPAEIPPAVGQAFLDAMRAYHAEQNPIVKQQIAGLTARDLRAHWPGRIRLDQVEAMFKEMRAHLDTGKPPRARRSK
jgi:hypothetical protein